MDSSNGTPQSPLNMAIDEFEDEDSSESAMMAVASAEEYTAKIIKLQQACLIPLKEDLAEWLNKILKTSQITTDNFMEKLDNGVIICRLAKIISLWCKQQLETREDNATSVQVASKALKIEPPSPRPRFHSNDNNHTPSTTMQFSSPLRASSTSLSTNHFIKTSASATSLNNGFHLSYQRDQFINNLIRMHRLKIWDNAKCRTFYARDNVCNFIKWSRDFGVNRSILFESDDLVLHANPRQVVLCLLDVARIAYVNYNFTEAPGLVKFEQLIDKELAYKRANGGLHNKDGFDLPPKRMLNSNGDILDEITSSIVQGAVLNSSSGRDRASIGDATDELVIRYCRHKEEEAARKRQLEIEQEHERTAKQYHRAILDPVIESADSSLINSIEDNLLGRCSDQENHRSPEPDSLMPNTQENRNDLDSEVTSTSETRTTNANDQQHIFDRVDSLDSGEGPTESASTAYSSGPRREIMRVITTLQANPFESNQTPNQAVTTTIEESNPSPTPASLPTTSSVTENSELSSSRSSLLSNQDCNNSTSHHYGRQITSDLDGKVMRIAKSYYGKKATKDVTRLSEGKYKIADRIVFVRLLKGHRVMVRIGGGWDTLENFLFRHKSDPTQVIDPDNLLPLETKMSLEKNGQLTPKTTPSRSPAASRLPNYRRSNSASSTNLSNLSFSNLSLASSSITPSKQKASAHLNSTIAGNVYSSSPSVHQTPKRQIPRLLIHKGQSLNRNLVPRSLFNSDNKKQQFHANQQRFLPQIPSAQVITPTKSKY